MPTGKHLKIRCRRRTKVSGCNTGPGVGAAMQFLPTASTPQHEPQNSSHDALIILRRKCRGPLPPAPHAPPPPSEVGPRTRPLTAPHYLCRLPTARCQPMARGTPLRPKRLLCRTKRSENPAPDRSLLRLVQRRAHGRYAVCQGCGRQPTVNVMDHNFPLPP